jgi:hypothetical protein
MWEICRIVDCCEWLLTVYGVVGLKALLGAELVWGKGFLSSREFRESLVKNAFAQFCCHTR